MIEHVFALPELRDDMEVELRRLASGSAQRESPAAALDQSHLQDMGRGSSQQDWAGLRRLAPVPDQDVDELAIYIRSLLPWRSLADGAPVAMDVTDAGTAASPHSIRPIGTPYVVISVDSWDAADAVQEALFDVAGLAAAEWTAGWTGSDHGFREIAIYPPFDIAA